MRPSFALPLITHILLLPFLFSSSFLFNDTATTEIYTLSLHDALPISTVDIFTFYVPHRHVYGEQWIKFMKDGVGKECRSEERFSRNAETDLVCRLLLEKKNK